MIQIEADEICAECEYFRAVSETNVIYHGAESIVVTNVRCESKAKCDIIKKMLEAKMRKTDEAR